MGTLVTFTGDRFLRNATSDGTKSVEMQEKEAEAAHAVLAMMEGQSPAEMDVEKLQQVLQTCRFFMADALVQGFAPYLAGVAWNIPSAEVCSLPPAGAVTHECWRRASALQRAL